ncbi:hypothetical protein pipiens_015264 [Culex pipiens pipiens]|uniref:DUF4806 domain-containing protein n=1 Tax=Culex pipiens pipiens TaxID=38569 RepID=A0ABD1CRD1_CULPP
MDYTNIPYQQQPSYPVIHHSDSGILNQVLLNQQSMMANQTKMMQSLTLLESRLESLAEAVKAANPTPTAIQTDLLTPVVTMDVSVHTQTMVVSPVNSLLELNELERRLQDDKVMNSYLEGMSYICGTSGKAQFPQCCNKLIDYFITPDFLQQCTWVGSMERSLKFYRNFRSLFTRLVMQADKDFTEMKSDKFFKTLLKSSKETDTELPADLVALENQLQDEKVMNDYIKDMGFICGTSGKARALNCCYKLIDYFVTREFLMQCSWTGASRTTEDPLNDDSTEEKIPFKFYRRFRTLFLRLILQADKDFSELQFASLEELDALEKQLHDDAQMRKYLTGMSFICGTSDKARAVDCCYKLIDYFVTRDFLTQCSWTGIARASDGTETTTEKKIPMKFYVKFRALFTSLVLLVDRDFSEFQCEKFFKTILKNAKQRLFAKTMTSRQKNRPCNLKYNKKLKKKIHEVYVEEHEQEPAPGGHSIKNEIYMEYGTSLFNQN